MEGEGVQYLNNLGSALLPAIPEIAPALNELSAVSEVLAHIGVTHRIAPVLVRNFEYYTGPVFSLYSAGQKLGGGGRYDALVSLVGGASAPASGFALDIDVISSLLPDAETDGRQSIAIRSTGKDRADIAAAFSLATMLRQTDVRVEIVAEAQEPSRVEVAASATGFLLTADGQKTRQFSAVEDVVRAVADSTRD
jgi:histidyl-tRNA synthetase